MGRALYHQNSRHMSPGSSTIASPCSPKHILPTPKSPSYLSPRSPHYLSPLSPRYPNYLSPPPEPHVFVDAKNKDLPFDGNYKMPSHFTFEPCLGLKEQGEILMNFLTGTAGSPKQKLVPRLHKVDCPNSEVDEHNAQSPHGTHGWKSLLGINRRKFEKKPSTNLTLVSLVDMGVDTMDLQELTRNGDEDDDTDYDEREEAQRKLEMEMEQHDGKKPVSLEDYMEMVKKSTGRIGIQAQLLQELSLGEDVNMGIPESELPATPPLETLGTEIKPGESSNKSKEHETKAIPIYRGAMRATSLVIKRLRRMAGLMHIEQQRSDLKEVYDWLQHLGYLATSPGKLDPSMFGSPGGHPGGVETGEPIDWRLPSSPAQALEMAQADLRDRLAFLYEEQNQIKNRKEQLEAAKRIVGRRMSKVEVQRLSKYLKNLKKLEVGYEELGGRIVQNLDDVKSLETQFKSLSEKDEELVQEGKGTKGSKSSKKDRKAGVRVQSSPPSEDEDKSEKSTIITKKEFKTDLKVKQQKDSPDEKELKPDPSEVDSTASDVEKLEKVKKRERPSSPEESDGAAAALGLPARKPLIQEADGRGPSSERKLVGPGSRRSIQQQDGAAASERAGMKPQQQQGVEWSSSGSGGEGSPVGEIADSGVPRRLSGRMLVSRQHVVTADKEIQTDHSDLLTLMESMMEAIDEEAPAGTEGPAAKLKRVLKENKRMKVQLRFWRSRNWLESSMATRASRVGSIGSSRTGSRASPSLMMDSSSEDELSMYFNPYQGPRAGSAGSSASGAYSEAQATRSPRISPGSPSIYGRDGSYGASRPTLSQTTTNKTLQQFNRPSITVASSSNRANADILLETLQAMQPRHFYSSNNNAAISSRSRNPEGIQSSASESINNTKLNFKSPSHGLEPPSSNQGNTQRGLAVPAVQLEPLNAALSTNNWQGITQSPQRTSHPLSARPASNQLQPIPAEVLNAALRARAPNQGPRQLSSRTIPSINFGAVESFPPSKSLTSANSRIPKVSKSLHPLHSEPNTSRVSMDVPSGPAEQLRDTLLSGNLPNTVPIEEDTDARPSPRNGRNASRNLSPRPPVSSQQLREGPTIPSTSSGSPPRSPRRAASPMRRSHGSATPRELPKAENGLMVVGRSSTAQ